MTYLHVGSRVPVLFMRINVAKEDVYLCRILAVEVRRVKCVFPRNEVQKEMIFENIHGKFTSFSHNK